MRQFFAGVIFASMASSYTQVSNPSDELDIRNKLSLYAFAVDNKDFSNFDQLFTKDVSVDYVGQTYTDLAAFTTFLDTSVAGKVTQHAISSTVVDTSSGATTPNSTSYVVATFLGQGNQTGTSLALYGKYLDSWVKDEGAWRIKRRVLTLFVSVESTICALY